ncbi:colicin-like pore-forming protein [Hafnia alvei]|uniref:colicin-like pore-forming protein n=1 Tax=Hafnia alvei TaxID=569 RepID=UPI001F19F758|nr:colicin-like pore-forming protein [Hafnia alvei]MCE9871475.1 colicin-like pore-forming protein [Hafnia alvei]
MTCRGSPYSTIIFDIQTDPKDAVKFTADFYKEVFKVYGEKAEKLAKLLADQAKGKKIRNVEDALKSYEKHKANINKKINAKDREAIAKALESMDVGKAAKNIAKFSKGLGWVGPAIDITDWFTELYKAVKTDNWRSLYVKTETIAVGLAATHVTALAFSAVLGGPIGILGYGLIMAGVGALVNETIVDEANKFIGL